MSERIVAVLAFDGMQSLDVTGPFEVFAAANGVLDGLGRPGDRYRPRLVGLNDRPDVVTAESGLMFATNGAVFRPGRIDTLILPGGDGVHAVAADPAACALVATAAGRSRRVATVCTGAFLGAAAGIFQPGQRVATHWARAARLARAHPRLVVDADSIHVRHGDVWSSAGVTAGIDLALALVEEDHGAEVAQTVARWLVVFLRRPGGQSQFAAPVWSQAAEREPVRAALDLIHADPARPLGLAALAAHAGVSERHLLRLFNHEVGTTPVRYVEGVRIEAARRLLETGDSGLAAVARSCGFGTAETLRRAFHRRVGVAPDHYRQRFRHPVPAP